MHCTFRKDAKLQKESQKTGKQNDANKETTKKNLSNETSKRDLKVGLRLFLLGI